MVTALSHANCLSHFPGPGKFWATTTRLKTSSLNSDPHSYLMSNLRLKDPKLHLQKNQTSTFPEYASFEEPCVQPLKDSRPITLPYPVFNPLSLFLNHPLSLSHKYSTPLFSKRQIRNCSSCHLLGINSFYFSKFIILVIC